MRLSARSEKGRTRAVNQDSFIIEEISGGGPLLAAVADGMGGHLAGEVASALAVSVLRQHILETTNGSGHLVSLSQAMTEGFCVANQAIVESAQGQGKYGMGTTLTAAILDGQRLCIGHVGDSRAYLLFSDRVLPITHDHSVVGELVRKGDLTAEEAMRHPQRNVLTRALGIENSVTVDVVERDVEDANGLLICSDGITGLLTRDDVQAVIASGKEPDLITESLISLAVDKGGYDDATCVLCFFDPPREGGGMD